MTMPTMVRRGKLCISDVKSNFKSRHLKVIYPFNIRNISGIHKNILLEYFMRISGPKERQIEPFYRLIFIQKKKKTKEKA